jgi:hypothetical protein
MRASRSLAAIPLLLRSPASAFDAIRERPGWIGAFLLCLALFALAFFVQLPQSLRYQREVTRSTMEKFDVPTEQVEEALAKIPQPGSLSAQDAVQQILLPAVFLLPPFFLGAFVFHLLAKAFGAEPSFKLSLGIFSIAQIVSAIGALAKGALARASDTIEVSLSPAALLPGAGFHSALGIFLDLFDVFSILNLALLAVGAQVGFQVPRHTAWSIAGSYWVLKSLVVFALRLSQSWFAGTL